LVGGIWGKRISAWRLFAEILMAMGPETAQSIPEMIADRGSENNFFSGYGY